MPTIGRIGSILIRLYYDDHGIPHFHAVSPNSISSLPLRTAPSFQAQGIYAGAIWRQFMPLQDGHYFVANMRVADDLLGIEWPNRVDFSADGLRFRAFPEEEKVEFEGVASASNAGGTEPSHHPNTPR